MREYFKLLHNGIFCINVRYEHLVYDYIEVAISMDKLNCGQGIGLEWKCNEEGLVQNLGGRDISQSGCFGDTSDERTGILSSMNRLSDWSMYETASR